MPQYLVAGYLPDDFDPSQADEAMAESSSPTGRIFRPRNTSAVFGYWNALTWTRRWHGRAKASPPLGNRARCERSFSVRQPTRN